MKIGQETTHNEKKFEIIIVNLNIQKIRFEKFMESQPIKKGGKIE